MHMNRILIFLTRINLIYCSLIASFKLNFFIEIIFLELSLLFFFTLEKRCVSSKRSEITTAHIYIKISNIIFKPVFLYLNKIYVSEFPYNIFEYRR